MIDINKDAKFILESLQGSLVVDADEKIQFMSTDLMNTVGVDSFEKIKGKRLRDVISTNNTYRVLETGEAQIAETYLVQGYTIVSNGYPIYKEGKLVGAIEFDIFQNVDIIQDFFDKISSEKDIKAFSDTLQMRKRNKFSLDNIKGSSSVIKKMKNEIKMAARTNSTVLVTGETGTGKELIAKAVHYSGHRALFNFVEVNCATIPAELFESELFGYEEGSFTGAKKGGKKGLAEVADRGTLFLDEVNALPIFLQAKLLRFLQEREIQRVGGNSSIPLDLRVIAATNEDLSAMVESGDFRKDLFYRLNVIEINAEPLRNRKDDIPELVNFIINKLSEDMGRKLESNQISGIDTKALKLLMDYEWPGNVRELQNAVERAINKCNVPVLNAEHFEDLFPEKTFGSISVKKEEFSDLTLKEMKNKIEERAINELLNNQGLSITDAAALLGISRQMLHRKINYYNIRQL